MGRVTRKEKQLDEGQKARMLEQVDQIVITREDRLQFTSAFRKLATVLRNVGSCHEADSRLRMEMATVNLDRIQEAIDAGLIDPNLPITMKTLKEARIIGKIEDGVKLLARVSSSQLSSIDS